jgi:hypothetical protein
MPAAFPTNTTCDVYRPGNAPPAAPDVPGVPASYAPRWRNIKGDFAGLTPSAYDALLVVPLATDLRDGDAVYIPDQTGFAHACVYVERLRGVAGGDVLRGYLTHAGGTSAAASSAGLTVSPTNAGGATVANAVTLDISPFFVSSPTAGTALLEFFGAGLEIATNAGPGYNQVPNNTRTNLLLSTGAAPAFNNHVTLAGPAGAYTGLTVPAGVYLATLNVQWDLYGVTGGSTTGVRYVEITAGGPAVGFAMTPASPVTLTIAGSDYTATAVQSLVCAFACTGSTTVQVNAWQNSGTTQNVCALGQLPSGTGFIPLLTLARLGDRAG